MLAARWQQQRQVAVGDPGGDGQLAQVARKRRFLRIHHLQIHLRADVAAAVTFGALAAGRGAGHAGGGVVGRMRVARAVKRGVKRVEPRFHSAVHRARSPVAHHLGQRMHLEVLRPGAVWHQVEFAHALGYRHPIKPFVEQVDDRHAVQLHMLGTDQFFQRCVATREQQHKLNFAARHARQHIGQAGDARKLKALGKSEIFLHQPKTRETGGGCGQQGFVVGKTDRLDRAGRQGAHDRGRIAPAAHGLHHHTDRLAQAAFVQLPGHIAGAAEMQHQLIERELVEGEPSGGAQPNAQTATNVARTRMPGQRQIGRVGEVLNPCDLQRPQPQRAAGAKFAVGVLAHGLPRPQAAAPGQRWTSRQARIVQLGCASDHRHRRRGGEEMRVNDIEQVPGEARVFGVELEAHAC